MSAVPAFSEPDNQIELLRAELDALRADYEVRLTELEARLDAAERQATTQQETTAVGRPL